MVYYSKRKLLEVRMGKKKISIMVSVYDWFVFFLGLNICVGLMERGVNHLVTDGTISVIFIAGWFLKGRLKL